jgi:hypothetical protein
MGRRSRAYQQGVGVRLHARRGGEPHRGMDAARQAGGGGRRGRNDFFGVRAWRSSGDTVAVGAYGDDKGSAAGRRTCSRATCGEPDAGWTQRAKLVAQDGAVGDEFGWSVAIERGHGGGGGIWDDDKGSDSGSVYVFTRDVAGNLTRDGRSVPSWWRRTARQVIDFGLSVAIDGTRWRWGLIKTTIK